jgi:hypothetical protein
MTGSERIKMTRDEWEAEGLRRFGEDKKSWKFKCPVCKHVASVQDYLDAKAPEGDIGMACIGRSLSEQPYRAFGSNPKGAKKSPCDYAGYGFFQFNPVEIIGEGVRGFEFA